MRDGNVLIGWGMATSTYPTHRMPANAYVRVNADGSALVRAGTQDLGTGTYTVMAQVAADALGVPVERIQIELGNSEYPHAPVSGGSMTVASVGPAVKAACEAVRAKLNNATNDGTPVPELLSRRNMNFVEASGEAKSGDEQKHYSMHAFGAQFAEVRVDADLGAIRVSRYVGAFDGGRIMNAKTACSQLIGGIVFGIGMALFEETHVDGETGRVVNSNVSEYLMPVNADIPDIQAIVVPNDELVSNPLGAKGIGELPMVGVAAAVANAVYHATGIRVRKVPIRIEDVLA
jgi:xanthine dehydrogenase YagR molybdenum-binding subunit